MTDTTTLHLGDDLERLAHVCGPLDNHLRWLERECQVRIQRRGSQFTLSGEAAARQLVRTLLTELWARAREPLADSELSLLLAQHRAPGTAARTLASGAGSSHPDSLLSDSPVNGPTHAPDQHTANDPAVFKRLSIRPRTTHQGEYLKAITAHDLTFGIGPAGTGKTYLAVASAVDALERDQVKRLVLTRPAVEAGERLGFLPGDLAQKVDPYLRPLFDALYELLGFERTVRLQERGTIEVAPLAFMRGRTLNSAFVLLDEAQNTTTEQMKMFLTRIGHHAKMVVNGDVTQIDLPRGQTSGLVHAAQVLEGVPGVGFTWFDASDIVRHPLVGRIVDAYVRHHAHTQP